MYVLDKFGYFLSVLRNNPFELFRLLRIGMKTAQYRYLIRCAGAGTVVGAGTQIINSSNVRIGRKCLLLDSIYIRAGAQGEVMIADRVAINSFCRFLGMVQSRLVRIRRLDLGLSLQPLGMITLVI